MKLYTEEEIRRLLKEQIIFDDEDFDKLTPIELPSDEEIDAHAQKVHDDLFNEFYAYTDGAKWMRDKIQGGNK